MQSDLRRNYIQLIFDSDWIWGALGNSDFHSPSLLNFIERDFELYDIKYG